MLQNHSLFGTLCAVCCDTTQPAYFYKKYNRENDTFTIQFLWKLDPSYMVEGVSQENLETFLSLKLDPNYRDLVQILTAIRDGGEIIFAQSPWTELKYEVHMTPAMLEWYTEMAK